MVPSSLLAKRYSPILYPWARGSGRYSGRSRNLPTSTARRTRSSSQSIRSLSEGATLWVVPELAYPVGAVEVGKHQDVEQLGTWSRAESF
jgi:hypothetical protein